MRRDVFLKSLAALAAVGALPMSVRAAGANLKMMIHGPDVAREIRRILRLRGGEGDGEREEETGAREHGRGLGDGA